MAARTGKGIPEGSPRWPRRDLGRRRARFPTSSNHQKLRGRRPGAWPEVYDLHHKHADICLMAGTPETGEAIPGQPYDPAPRRADLARPRARPLRQVAEYSMGLMGPATARTTWKRDLCRLSPAGRTSWGMNGNEAGRPSG